MKRRSLLLSITTLALVLTLIAGATFALFTDSVRFENHLQAGTLDITLTRTKLVTKTLNNQGLLNTTTDNEPMDFSDSTSNEENIFGITDDTLIVPGSTFYAKLELTNNSTVAFDYYIKVVWDTESIESESEKAESEKLAKQLKVTVEAGEETSSEHLNTGVQLGEEDDPLDRVLVGKTKVFTVKVEFENLDNNNDAQGKNVKFDLFVYAIQATA